MIQIFPGHSTLQLIVFINNLLEAKGSNKNNVIYLDVRKAFDSVPDSKFLVKSRSYIWYHWSSMEVVSSILEPPHTICAD